MGRRRRRGDWAEGGADGVGLRGPGIQMKGWVFLAPAHWWLCLRDGLGQAGSGASWLPLTCIPASQVGTLQGERLRGN